MSGAMQLAQDLPAPALETSAIRARRRPGGVFAFWGLRLLAAWLLAAPVASALGGTGMARFPNGDALLFAPGGTYLVAALMRGLGPLAAALQDTVWFALILGYLSLVPLAGLMYALCHGGRLRPGDVARSALEQFAPFTLLAGLTLVVQAAVVLLGILLLSVLRQSIHSSLDPRDTDLWLLGAAGLVLLVVLAVGIVQDLARSALVRHRQGVRSALVVALQIARKRPLQVLLGWAVPAICSVAAVALGALAVGALHVERAGSARVIGALGLHQLVALALVAMKATWLAAALRLAGEPVAVARRPTPQRWRPASGGTPADSDAPDGPSPDPDASSGA